MKNAGLEEAQAGMKIAGRNINNLRYADATILMAESEEELKNLLMKVKASMDLMVYCNWITTSYNNSCFNLFFVSKFFMPLSL